MYTVQSILLQKLTYKAEYVNQVSHLEEKLRDAIAWLTPLFEANCTKEEALRAWNKVFKHSYWVERAEEVEAAKAKGEELRAARAAGGLYVALPGQVSTSRPKERSVPIPEHRFYGSDE